MFESNIELIEPFLQFRIKFDEHFEENLELIKNVNSQVEILISLESEDEMDMFLTFLKDIDEGTHLRLSLNKQLFLSFNFEKLLGNSVLKNIQIVNDRFEICIFRYIPSKYILQNNQTILERHKVNINPKYIGHDIKSREIIFKAKELFKELKQSEVRNKALENKISKIKDFIEQF